jgi:hypothetical protein
MDEEAFNNLLMLQMSRCAMCGERFTDERPPVVDHDHLLDEVRGLLHQVCNRALGVFEKHRANCERYLKYVANRKAIGHLCDGTVCEESGEVAASSSSVVEG